MPEHPAFWKYTALEELTPAQWESLCDGCGKCCLRKLEDEETREVFYTRVACRLLDTDSATCTDYRHRAECMPDCVTLTPEVLTDPYWLPATCAYRLLAEGKNLPAWHPLISGDPRTVTFSGNSVAGRVVSERVDDDLEAHLIDWITS